MRTGHSVARKWIIESKQQQQVNIIVFHTKTCPCPVLLAYQNILIMKCDKKGVGFYLIWYTNVALSTVFSYYCMHLLASGQYRPFLLGSVGQLYPYLSVYLLTHVTLRQILEQIDGKSESLVNAENCVDKVINNCILYMTIFSGLLCSGRYQDIYTQGQVLQLAELFLWGRVIFSIGYLLGTAIGVQSLRSYGFGLNIGSLAALITPFFHTNFLSSFK